MKKSKFQRIIGFLIFSAAALFAFLPNAFADSPQASDIQILITKTSTGEAQGNSQPISGVPYTVKKIKSKTQNLPTVSDPASYEIVTGSAALTLSGATNAAGNLQFSARDGLVPAMYLIEEGKSDYPSPAPLMLIQLPYRDPETQQMVYQIHLYPKTEHQTVTPPNDHKTTNGQTGNVPAPSARTLKMLPKTSIAKETNLKGQLLTLLAVASVGTAATGIWYVEMKKSAR